MSSLRLVYSVDRVSIMFIKGAPPSVKISADGKVPTGGWTNARLVEISHPLPVQDGYLHYAFEAIPPTDLATQMVTLIHAEAMRQSIPPHCKGVEVRAESNTKEAPIPRP